MSKDYSINMDHFPDSPSVIVGVVSVAIVLYSSSILTMRMARVFPMIGIDSMFKHRLAVNYSFFSNAERIINDGYKRVGQNREKQYHN